MTLRRGVSMEIETLAMSLSPKLGGKSGDIEEEHFYRD